MTATHDLARLAAALIGGVIFGVAVVELLIALSLVNAVGYGADVAGGAAGLGLGLLRFGGPARSPVS